MPQLKPQPFSAFTVLTAFAAAALIAAVPGCKTPTEEPSAGPPPVTYTGPDFLRGTVASLCQIRRFEPQLVSGYGVVVLPRGSGTGSSEVPAAIREQMIQYAQRMGIGSPQAAQGMPERYKPFMHMSPEEFFQSEDTALVAVEGLVPPGAVPGTRFDVLVSALPQTQTTSLAGGALWTTELSVTGTRPGLRSFTVAEARGPIYLDPFEADSAADEQADDEAFGNRQAVVITGGRATRRRTIELILNQPSWTRSQEIADRINERFPPEPEEKLQTAKAITESLIQVRVPAHFAREPVRLIDLISHLYIQRGAGFEEQKARQLAEALVAQPEHVEAVVLAWRVLGRTIVAPVLREYYDHPRMHVRLAALEAGASLEDGRASRYLAELASHDDPEVREHVARALVNLPYEDGGREALRRLLDDSREAMRTLLNDPEPMVRIAAYESLAMIDDDGPLLRRSIVREAGGRGLKYVIDQVQSERPLIYITHEDAPRIVIFNSDLECDLPMLARLWDNRLIFTRDAEEADVLEVYYQAPHQIEGRKLRISPKVASLAYMLGHQPSDELPAPGLALSYSRAVNVLHRLSEGGHIDAPIEVRSTGLAPLIQRHRDGSPDRPEIGADTDSGGESGYTSPRGADADPSPSAARSAPAWEESTTP
ncbi:MAG: flagellar basal body P-ring protein FlgI [Phycisphaeraceae bacterium]